MSDLETRLAEAIYAGVYDGHGAFENADQWIKDRLIGGARAVLPIIDAETRRAVREVLDEVERRIRPGDYTWDELTEIDRGALNAAYEIAKYRERA